MAEREDVAALSSEERATLEKAIRDAGPIYDSDGIYTAVERILAAHDERVGADAWDEGCSHTDDPASVVPCPHNPYRLHDLDDVAREFGVHL